MPPRVTPVESNLALVRMLRCLEIPEQFVDAAKFQVSPEDGSDQFGFFFDDRDLAVLHLIAKRQVTSDP